jgi:A/G-specific adenine glycosylase
MEPHRFHTPLMNWYTSNHRSFPWRENPNTFHTWICETMSQQTLLKVVLPKFIEFIREFPSLDHLARAHETQLRKVWQGLGYYARARNLQKGAQYICEKKSSVLPQTYNDWIEVPGVGPYTASILASIHNKEKVACVDGNVIRVMSRLFGIENPWNKKGAEEIKMSAQQLMNTLPNTFLPGNYNQAVMELGATVCKKQNPLCSVCPVSSVCHAFKTNQAAQIPQTKPKVEKIGTHLLGLLFVKSEFPSQVGVLNRSGKFLKNTTGFPLVSNLEPIYSSLLNKTLVKQLSLLPSVPHTITNHKISATPIVYCINHKKILGLRNHSDAENANLEKLYNECESSITFVDWGQVQNNLSSSLDKKLWMASKLSRLF